MPKMTRAWFVGETDRVWRRARANFARDGVLSGAVIGYDAMARQTMLLAMSEEQFDDPVERDAVLRSGTVPLRGDFSLNVDRIGEVFREARVVAAVRISEAWFAEGALASELMARNMRPSEHPDAVEVAVVSAMWPREFFVGYYRARIERPEGGGPVLGPDLPALAEDGEFGVESWLYGVLPQPY